MHDKKKPKLTFSAENLAVPEIHTGEVEPEDELPENTEEIQYDTVAIPEIHLKKHKESDSSNNKQT